MCQKYFAWYFTIQICFYFEIYFTGMWSMQSQLMRSTSFLGMIFIFQKFLKWSGTMEPWNMSLGKTRILGMSFVTLKPQGLVAHCLYNMNESAEKNGASLCQDKKLRKMANAPDMRMCLHHLLYDCWSLRRRKWLEGPVLWIPQNLCSGQTPSIFLSYSLKNSLFFYLSLPENI